MPAIHKSSTYKQIEVKNPFLEGQDKAYADILQDKMRETRWWRLVGIGNLILFFAALCFFIYAVRQQKTVPVLVNVMPSGDAQYAELVDHHALIPLTAIPAEASEEERNVFSLVFKQFFTVFKPDYIYNAIKITVDIAGFHFLGNGIEILQPGWKPTQDGDDDEDEQHKENYAGLAEGGEYPVDSVVKEEKYTEPKKHYTYASLLALMENPCGEDGKRLTGLGTPATRGSILKKLFDRNYLSLKGKNLLIAGDGTFLIENIKKNEALSTFISIPETTRWEEELHTNTGSFLDGIKTFVRHAVETTAMEHYQVEKTSLGKCPLCGGAVYEGKKGCYCLNYKSEPPCRFTIWKEIAGASVSPADVQTLLAGKQTKAKKCKSKAGKEFQAAFKLEAGEVKFIFDTGKPAGKK